MTSASSDVRQVVCLSNIDWNFLWQRHQILMSGLSARGVEVAFVAQMDASRAVAVHDWRRVLHRASATLRELTLSHRVDHGVHILNPPIVPLRAAQGWNLRVVVPLLARWLRHRGFRRPVVWTYAYGPNATALEHLLSPSLVVYDCVNRVAGYALATPEMIQNEEALTRRADVVVTDSAILFEEKSRQHPRTFRLLPGVDYELFAPSAGNREPLALAGLPHPRVGFFGSIDDRFDQETVANFAAQHPAWSVIVIGPAQVRLAALKKQANVRIVGPVPYRELGRWLQYVDILTVPYHPTPFTRGIIPAKLFEMLATGKPVVAMGLPELEPYAHFITLSERSEFAAAIVASVERDSPLQRERRMTLARKNSWESRVDAAHAMLIAARHEVRGAHRAERAAR